MSDLAKVTASPRSDIIDGHVVPKAKLVDLAMIEERFERDLMARAGDASIGLPDKVGDKIIAAAVDKVSTGHYRYGRQGFWAIASANTSLPFLTFVLLRREQGITIEKARMLITPENEMKVWRGVLEQVGFDMTFLDKKADTGDAPPNDQAETDPIGGSSPPLSEEENAAV